MHREQNRRRFISLAGGGFAGTAGMSWAGAAFADPQEPDLIVYNAKVQTVDPAMPTAQAFAVRSGRFVAVGGNDIKSLAGKKTQSYDAKGMMVVPGFIDTHNHAGAGGAAFTGNAGGEGLLYDVHVGNPYEVEQVSIASIIAKLQAKAQHLPPDTWVVGNFLDDTKLSDKRPLNVHDLDKVSAGHPVAVIHRGGHTMFVNSKAFQIAGVTKATPNPFGGTFDKDVSGELNGRASRTAPWPAIIKAGKRDMFTPAQKAKRCWMASPSSRPQVARPVYGLTTVHHNEDGALEAIQEQRLRGNLLHRVSYEASGALAGSQLI